MKINGVEAVVYLATKTDRVALHKKDNTDKFWSYKLKSARKTEFAFDPRTKDGLYLRVDRIPPSIAGISKVERISGKGISTALDRVFTGGLHRANFYCEVESQEALESLISYYESL